MANFRVIAQDTTGEGDVIYRIEDVYDGSMPNTAFFVQHMPFGICTGRSIDDLRKRLEELLKACDKPPLVMRPESLVELK